MEAHFSRRIRAREAFSAPKPTLCGGAARRVDPPRQIRLQPMATFGSDQTTADILGETLVAWAATHAFGIGGDGINSIIDTLRKRQEKIGYIG
jgi:pyruvate dehydrogenase (quinone)